MTIGSVIFFGVVGSNNAINVLNQSSLFVNIIKGHTPEVTFTVNRNEHHKGYYLTDGIYPSWSVLMKGVPLPEQEKHKIFSTKQSTLRKDVKCAFGLLKKRFNILVIPDRSYSQCTLLGLIVRACIFLYNMIFNDERDNSFDENYHTITSVVVLPINYEAPVVSQASFIGMRIDIKIDIFTPSIRLDRACVE
jgi:hypothetical protein